MFGSIEKQYGKSKRKPSGRNAAYTVLIKDVKFYVETSDTSPELISKFRRMFQTTYLNELWCWGIRYRKYDNLILDDKGNTVAKLITKQNILKPIKHYNPTDYPFVEQGGN